MLVGTAKTFYYDPGSLWSTLAAANAKLSEISALKTYSKLQTVTLWYVAWANNLMSGDRREKDKQELLYHQVLICFE